MTGLVVAATTDPVDGFKACTADDHAPLAPAERIESRTSLERVSRGVHTSELCPCYVLKVASLSNISMSWACHENVRIGSSNADQWSAAWHGIRQCEACSAAAETSKAPTHAQLCALMGRRRRNDGWPSDPGRRWPATPAWQTTTRSAFPSAPRLASGQAAGQGPH